MKRYKVKVKFRNKKRSKGIEMIIEDDRNMMEYWIINPRAIMNIAYQLLDFKITPLEEKSDT